MKIFCKIPFCLCPCLIFYSMGLYGADLVKDGVAVGEFILSADASQAEVFAATDVRHWIEEITGAKVPILSKPSPGKNTKVFAGTNFASDFKEDLKALAGNDGFAIRRKRGDVYVFGSRPRGTMYGMFALLEKNSDIIWARPNIRFGTVFGKTGDLALTDTDCLDIPVFAYRSMEGGYPAHIPTGIWQLHNRNNETGRFLYGPEMDLVNRLACNLSYPIDDQFKDHPEYFAYYPATSERKGLNHGNGSMCITHPGLPEIWAKGVLKLIAAREARDGFKVDVFRIGPGDNWYCCRCPECTKPIKLPDGTTLEMKHPDATKDPLFRSTQIYMFLNEAIKTLHKARPDVQLAVLAYIHMAEPPKVKLDPNITIYFAPYPTNNMHFPLLDPRQPAQWRERFDKWLKMTDTLGLYEYLYSKPEPLAYYVAENLRALLGTANYRNAIIHAEIDNDRNFDGKTNLAGASHGFWDIGGMMNTWVIARLFWNPKQDVDALYRYYIKRTFREAASQMTEYYELIKDSWFEPDDKTRDGAHISEAFIYENMIIKKKLEGKLFNILSDAEKAAKTSSSKHMIERMRARFVALSQDNARLRVAGIPEMSYDGNTFESVQWEKPQPLENFKITTRLGSDIRQPSEETQIKAAHDGKTLYIRFTATNNDIPNVNTVTDDGKTESWPKGDHIELWFSGDGRIYVFAFNATGHKYDAKDYDRLWNSGWDLKVRKTDKGYEGIAIIPMNSLELVPKEDPKLKWFCIREINHNQSKPEKISYDGKVLYETFYPIIVE